MLSIKVADEQVPCVVTLRGELSLSTVGPLAAALPKLLAEHGRLVIDLASLRASWVAALQVFPTALATAGGWPSARMALFRADEQLAAALHRVRVPDVVPLAQSRTAACALLATRPSRVMRYHELPKHLGSPERARALVRGACADWHVPAVAGPAELVASELVRNAVVHTGTPCRLSIALDSRGLHVTITDRGPERPAALGRRDAAAPCDGRRGSPHAVSTLSKAWGVTPRRGGKSVWALLSVEAS